MADSHITRGPTCPVHMQQPKSYVPAVREEREVPNFALLRLGIANLPRKLAKQGTPLCSTSAHQEVTRDPPFFFGQQKKRNSQKKKGV